MATKKQTKVDQQKRGNTKSTNAEDREAIIKAEIVNKDEKKGKKTNKETGGFDWKEVAEEVGGKGKGVLKAGTEKSGEALKAGAEKLGAFVKVGAEKIGGFTSHAADLAKLKLEERRLSSELNKQFQVVGEKLWRLYSAQKLNDVEASFSKDLKKIAKIEDALEENRKEQK